MSSTAILFVLRLASAALLLGFLCLVLWFLYQDLRSARQINSGQSTTFGSLRILANTSPNPAVNSLLELAPITTIGRNSRNTIVLDNTYISGEHALLEWRDSQWRLEDLGSRNGTLLNDVLLTDPVVLSMGDVITIGGIRLKLELPRKSQVGGGESGIRDSNP